MNALYKDRCFRFYKIYPLFSVPILFAFHLCKYAKNKFANLRLTINSKKKFHRSVQMTFGDLLGYTKPAHLPVINSSSSIFLWEFLKLSVWFGRF